MALKGNLRDFTITQLLNLINLAHKTGSLVIEGSNGPISMFFMDGKLAYAQEGQDDTSLAGILHKTNRISANQYQGILAHTAGMSDKELGLLLINANYFTQQDILASLQSYFLDVIKHMFTWVEGFFHFDNDVTPPQGRITIRLSLENIILEGSRQVEEWELLKAEIPSLQMALKFAERPGVNIRNIHLSRQEWRVISYVNPKNTLAQIARTTNMNELEIRQVVYSLLQAGLVEMVRPISKVVAQPTTTQVPIQTEPVNKEERRSLIGRLIDRIRSL
jgi:hypothetical protein